MVHDHAMTDTAQQDENASQVDGGTKDAQEFGAEQNVLSLTARQKKLLDTAEAVRTRAPSELSFGIDFLAETCLPISDPGSDTRIYSRRNGKLYLEIQPAHIRNPDGSSEFVYPYGSAPRRILIWCITEALRTKSAKLYLGTSLKDFITNKLNISFGGAQMQTFRKQALALFRASISITAVVEKGSLIEDRFEDFHIAQHGRLLTHVGNKGNNPKETESSYLVLNQSFYERIVGINGKGGKAFPLDMRAVNAIGNDALALDIYLWTVLRVYRADRGTKSVTIRWERLHSQFGADIQEKKRFKQKFLKAINKVGILYPGLNFESDRQTFTLLPSVLAIEAKQAKGNARQLRATGTNG